MTNNLLMSYLSYSRENQRLYRYILENSSDNERALSYLICRDFENNRSRFYNRNRPGNTYRPVRNFYPERESNNVERIPTIIPSTFFNPINISASLIEIANSCSVISYNNLTEEEKSQYTFCSITLNQFNSDSRVMKINHCGHVFSEEGLRQHFNNSVRCPICRYDIRSHTTSFSNTETNNNENENQNLNENNINNSDENFSTLLTRIRNNYMDNSGNAVSIDLCNNTIQITYTIYNSE
tara:strand:+ start:488 stop:1204 length:717 start_codon:yes stop_codon:yes gene_type:complete